MPQAVDLLVDGGILLDVGVAGREIRLGLVVVVVGDEVLHGVVGEELAELVAQLGGQRLVGSHDQRRLSHPGDDVGHGEGLARAGHAEQRLAAITALQTGGQSGHRLGLIPLQLVVGSYVEAAHVPPAASANRWGWTRV